MEKDEKIAKATEVLKKMLIEEYGIKSTDQYFSTEGEDMAVIYENMKVEQENFNLTEDELENILEEILDMLDENLSDK